MRTTTARLAGAVVLAAAAAGAASTLLAYSAAAAPRGVNGAIVYQATAGGHVQLFTTALDGTGVRQLTHDTNSDAVHAAWSPDGSRLVFERDFPHHAGVYTMAADGTDVRPLLTHGFQGMPAYSPNGRSIVFDRTLPQEDSLWIMRSDGTHLRQLTHNPPSGKDECRCDGSPVFAPDGRRVAFVRTNPDRGTAAFVVNADGSHLKRLTPWSMGVAAKIDWSPDGARIVLSSPEEERPRAGSNVFTIRPDGTGLRQVTHETRPGVHALADGYSPDGTKIVFARVVDGGLFQVFGMNVDGSGVTQITHGVDAHWANWGPAPATREQRR